jgi:hypothetical protein
MRLYWEDATIVLTTTPKESILGLLRQRAFSWDFGLFRVLLDRRFLMLGGESGAFYKIVLLTDLVAHPFRLAAVPMLFGMVLFNGLGTGAVRHTTIGLVRQSFAISFHFGIDAIKIIWAMSLVISAICVRGRPMPTLKWALFSLLYLFSPFVFALYYSLVATTQVSAEKILGATAHWLGLGLLLTYLWWVLAALFLLSRSSLQRNTKRELLVSVALAPTYYFVLLVWCKTIGICRALRFRVLGK